MCARLFLPILGCSPVDLKTMCKTSIVLFVLLAQALRADVIGIPKAPQSAQLLNNGYKHLQAGDLMQAEMAFRQLLDKMPRAGRAWAGLAEIAVRRKDPKAAAANLARAVQVSPEDVAVRRAYAAFLASRNEPARAEAELKAAAALDTADPEIHKQLGDLYLAWGKPAEAATAFGAALNRKPGYGEAQMGAGTAHLLRRDLPAAERAFRHAARLMPGSGLPMFSLGLALLESGQTEKAIAALDASLKTEPSAAIVLVARGDAWMSRGDSARAEADYRAAASAPNGASAALTRLGDLKASRGEWRAAEAEYRRAVQADPGGAEQAKNNLAWLLLRDTSAGRARQARLDEALKLAEQAANSPGAPAAYADTLGWIHHLRGESSQALAALRKARDGSPKDPAVRYHLGAAAAAAGQKAEAVRELTAALSISASFDSAADARRQLESLRR